MARGKKTERVLTPEEKLEQALVPIEEQPYPVPENWCWVYAQMLFDIEYGKGLSIKDLAVSGYPVFGANGQIGYYQEYMFESPQALMSCRGAYSGTMNKSLAFSYVTSNSLVIKSRICSMTADYICYLLSSQDTKKLVSGTAQPQVTVQAFSNYPIPVMPMDEQYRIVTRIESLFFKLDEAKEKVQAVLDGFETRKAVILHKAFSGELTAQWREKRGIGLESWIKCKLGDVLVEKPRNGYSPKPVNYETPYKSMTLSATTSGVFKKEFFKYIDEIIPDDSYLWLYPGDILIQRANSLDKVGICAVYTGGQHEFIYPDLMMKLKITDTNDQTYIAHFLNSKKIRKYYMENATGTAGNMPKINQKVVLETPVVLPPKEEQIEIVRILKNLLTKEQQVKETAEVVLEQIETIKKSILARAFRGELGTNNPSEESAVELLKSIL